MINAHYIHVFFTYFSFFTTISYNFTLSNATQGANQNHVNPLQCKWQHPTLLF